MAFFFGFGAFGGCGVWDSQFCMAKKNPGDGSGQHVAAGWPVCQAKFRFPNFIRNFRGCRLPKSRKQAHFRGKWVKFDG